MGPRLAGRHQVCGRESSVWVMQENDRRIAGDERTAFVGGEVPEHMGRGGVTLAQTGSWFAADPAPPACGTICQCTGSRSAERVRPAVASKDHPQAVDPQWGFHADKPVSPGEHREPG